MRLHTVDFTREPIIETIVTPKEGYKLVIRSSKSAGQEEYFVDAVEVVAFGHALFFRSLERPKAFLVPVSDYEILEVREARMVLKNVGLDRSIKIGGGKEGAHRAPREEEKVEPIVEDESEHEESALPSEGQAEARSDARVDKKRDRRRHYRKRRGRDDGAKDPAEIAVASSEDEKISNQASVEKAEGSAEDVSTAPNLLSSLLQPPPTLISETISRYRQNDLFKGAFYLTEDEQYKPHDKVHDLLNEEDEDGELPTVQDNAFESGDSEDCTSCEDIAEHEADSSCAAAADEPVDVQAKEEPIVEEENESDETSLPLFAEEEDPTMKEITSFIPHHAEEKPVEDHHQHVSMEHVQEVNAETLNAEEANTETLHVEEVNPEEVNSKENESEKT